VELELDKDKLRLRVNVEAEEMLRFERVDLIEDSILQVK